MSTDHPTKGSINRSRARPIMIALAFVIVAILVVLLINGRSIATSVFKAADTPNELKQYSSCTLSQMKQGMSDAKAHMVDTGNTAKCYRGGVAYQQYTAKKHEAYLASIPHTYDLSKDYAPFSSMTERIVSPTLKKAALKIYNVKDTVSYDVPKEHEGNVYGVITISKQHYDALAKQMHFVVNKHTTIYVNGANMERLVGLGKTVRFVGTSTPIIGGLQVVDNRTMVFELAYK